MEIQSKNALKGGSYSMIMTVILLAVLMAVNILVSILPSSITKFDMSSSKLYSITSNTKVVVNALEKDVTIYWVVQSDAEDEIIEMLLSKYESLSSHIEVVKKNPDIYPTFAEQYTDETISNNCLIVECGEKSRYIAYDEIYVQDTDMYSYTYTTSFDGEGLITSAIDYVVREDLPVLYTLEGHGEGSLPSTFSEQIEKANMTISSLSLLSLEAVPEDADAVIIYDPQSDISEEEKTKLTSYVEAGGKLLVMAGPLQDTTLTNLNSILGDYDVTVNEGIVVEGSEDHYFYGYPYIMIADMTTHEITDSLLEAKYYTIIPLAQGLTLGENADGVSTLLTTSDAAFSKLAGYKLDTYEKEEGDIDGPFVLGVSIETEKDGQLVWFSSAAFLDDTYNAYSSGANGDMAMNALSSMVGDYETIAIRSKSLNYNYLTISESTSSTLKTLMIGIAPLAYLAIGAAVILYRKKVQYEAA